MVRSCCTSALFIANYGTHTGYAWGTIESVFDRVAARLLRQGCSVSVAYPVLGGASPRLAESNAEVLEFDYGRTAGSLAALVRFLMLLSRRRTQLLYLTDQPSLSLRYLMFRLVGVRRIIVHDRTSGERRPRSRPALLIKRLLHRMPLVSADRVVAVSDFVAARLVAATGVPAQKVRRVYNGIDLSRYTTIQPDYIRTALGIAPDRDIVFFAGRANRYKGVDVLIRAISQLERDMQVTLVCCGDGPDLEEFQGLAHELGIEQAVFTGKRDDIPQLIAGATVAVVPSLWAEAFGLSVVEAMAAGVPVVASRTGGIPEIVNDGRTGLLVSAGDPTQLSNAIRRLLCDVRLRHEIGSSARSYAFDNFGLDRVADDLFTICCAHVE